MASAAIGLTVVLLPGCSSDPPKSDPSFCAASRAATKGCQEPSACDEILTASCGQLGEVLTSASLDAARDCLQSGVCGPASCVSRSARSATPSNSHMTLAANFCQFCAPDLANCEADFYGRASRLPGQLVLPYAPSVARAVDEACTTGAGCRATFSTCAIDTIAATVGSAVPADVAECVLQAFTVDEGESSGPGGGAAVATCTPDNCAGCCRDDVCQAGESPNACGTGGVACEVCSGQAACTPDGCKEPCTPDNCKGCCDGDTCLAGTDDGACGAGGAACSACEGSRVCADNTCIDASCQANCASGCCSASGCEPGTTATACGSGAGACVACGTGRTCTNHACVLSPTSLWDFYVSFAVIPEKSRSNNPWDAFGGLPDVFLTAISSEGTTSHSGTTSTKDDTLYPFWAETPLTGIKASELLSNLAFEVTDYDVTDPNDYIGGCKIPLTAEQFDGSLQNFTCPLGTRGVVAELYYRINPHP